MDAPVLSLADDGDDAVAIRSWWVLFPVSGITLTDRKPDLTRPLFGDATLLTVAHLRILEGQIYRRVGRDPRVLELARLVAVADRFTTYLAVCRRAPETAIDNEDVYEALIAAAKERAEQVSAALAVMLFAHRTDGSTCSLLERNYSRRQFITIIEFDEGDVGASSSALDHARTIVPREAVAISRPVLRAWRRDPLRRAIWDAVLAPASALPRSLRIAVTQAVVRLADAFTSPTLAAQLLGSVTALEVLLSYPNQGTGFEGVQQRAAALLSVVWTEQHHLKAVLQARHRYAHQGERIKDADLVLHALVLTTAAILVYAQGMATFRDKNALLAYLDIVAMAQRVQPSDAQRPLVTIRPVFPPVPDDLPMLALLDEDREPAGGYYRD